MKKTIIHETVIKVKRTTEIEEIENTDFVFYTDILETDTDGVKETTTRTGITSLSNIENVTGMKRIPDAVGMDGQLYVVAASREDYEKVIHGEADFADVVKYPHARDFQLPEDYVLLLWNFASHDVMDLEYENIRKQRP